MKWLNSIVKKFTITDIFLIELSSLAFGILLVKLIPTILTINIWLIITTVVILAIKPLHTVVKK